MGTNRERQELWAGEVEKSIYLPRLREHAGTINTKELIDTTISMVNETGSALIPGSIQDKPLLVDFLESCKDKPHEDFLADDHALLVQIIQILADTIILRHTAELSLVDSGNDGIVVLMYNPIQTTNEEHHPSPDGVGSDVSDGGVLAVLPGGKAARLLASGQGRPSISGSNPTDSGPAGMDSIPLRTAVMDWILHAPRHSGHNLDSKNTMEWKKALPARKIMLELLALDDHSLDAVRSYSATQHDMILSSIGSTVMDEDSRIDPVFLRAVYTSLLHGCKTESDGREPQDVLGSKAVGIVEDYDFGSWNEAREFAELGFRQRSLYVTFRPSNCYDHRFLDWMMDDSVVHRTHPVSIPEDPADEVMITGGPSYWRGTSGGNGFRVDGHGSKWYQKFVKEILPDELRGQITKERIMRLEEETGTISRTLTEYMLFNDAMYLMFDLLEARPGEPIDVGQIKRFIVRAVGHDIRSNLRSDSSRFLLCPNRPSLLLPRRSQGCGLDYLPRENNPHDRMARWNGLMKLYMIHLMIRHPNVLPTDYNQDLTPLDVAVLYDLTHAVSKMIYRNLFVLPMDTTAINELCDVCLDACMEFPESSDPELDPTRIDSVVLESLGSIYARMVNGDLKPIDRFFDRLDGVMVESAVDYYLSVQIKDKDLASPVGSVEDEARRTIASGYDRALEEWTTAMRSTEGDLPEDQQGKD